MTTDNKTTEAARAAFEDILDEAPLAPSWYAASGQESFQRLHREYRQRRPLLVSAAAAALVLVVVGSIGVASLVLRTNEPVGGGTSANTADATATPTTTIGTSTPNTTLIYAEVVLGSELGPEPRFDTSTLGDEVIPDRTANPAELLTEEELGMIFGPDPTIDTVRTGDPLYVGEVQGVHGLVIPALLSVEYPSDAGACFITKYILPGARPAGASWSCSSRGGDIQGFYSVSGDRPDEDAILFSRPLEALFLVDDADVSVIAIETAQGDQQWQRPIGGATLFVIDGVEGFGPFTVTAFDASGEVISTERFDPPIGPEAGRATGEAPDVVPLDGVPPVIIADTSSRFESPVLDIPSDPFSWEPYIANAASGKVPVEVRGQLLNVDETVMDVLDAVPLKYLSDLYELAGLDGPAIYEKATFLLPHDSDLIVTIWWQEWDGRTEANPLSFPADALREQWGGESVFINVDADRAEFGAVNTGALKMVEFSRLVTSDGPQPFTISVGEMRSIAAEVFATIEP
jgi:hypothetical protein